MDDFDDSADDLLPRRRLRLLWSGFPRNRWTWSRSNAPNRRLELLLELPLWTEQRNAGGRYSMVHSRCRFCGRQLWPFETWKILNGLPPCRAAFCTESAYLFFMQTKNKQSKQNKTTGGGGEKSHVGPAIPNSCSQRVVGSFQRQEYRMELLPIATAGGQATPRHRRQLKFADAEIKLKREVIHHNIHSGRDTCRNNVRTNVRQRRIWRRRVSVAGEPLPRSVKLLSKKTKKT